MGGCSTKTQWIYLNGQAQGTSFKITYKDSARRDFSAELTSLLEDVDRILSTYKTRSWISHFNTAKTPTQIDLKTLHPFAQKMIRLSDSLNVYTNGYFNAKLFPFLSSPQNTDSLLYYQKVIAEGIRLKQDSLFKTHSKAGYDFNAIAQGYSCDLIADFLKQKGVKNYMVEIGGELICNGKNPEDELWKVGIDLPEKERVKDQYASICQLNNLAMATSGNYRKFKFKEGKKYAHIINPITLEQVTHQTLSVTVVHPSSCAIADALATAYMSMGKEKALAHLQKNKQSNIGIYIIFEHAGTLQTFFNSKFESFLTNESSSNR